MLKVRYFTLAVPELGSPLASIIDHTYRLKDSRVAVVSASVTDLVLSYRVIRPVQTISILDDGSEVKQEYLTTDRHSIRIFEVGEGRLYLSIIDPPRSGRVVGNLLHLIVPKASYFFEPVEITKALVDRHIRLFDVAKLVSAKVRDFHVYDDAVGRLEITSRNGLSSEIAPFLDGKHFKIDGLSFEVISELTRGLVSYSANGTVRASGPIVSVAFPKLESCL